MLHDAACACAASHDRLPCQTALVEKKREASVDSERKAVMAHLLNEAGARKGRLQESVSSLRLREPPPPLCVCVFTYTVVHPALVCVCVCVCSLPLHPPSTPPSAGPRAGGAHRILGPSAPVFWLARSLCVCLVCHELVCVACVLLLHPWGTPHASLALLPLPSAPPSASLALLFGHELVCVSFSASPPPTLLACLLACLASCRV